MATATNLSGYGRRAPAPRRLSGALAAGTVIAVSASVKERIQIDPASDVRVRVKLTSIVGTCTAVLHPMLSDAGLDDTAGTRSTGGEVTATPTVAEDAALDFTARGERFLEIALTMSAAVGDTCTVAAVEVFVVARG